MKRKIICLGMIAVLMTAMCGCGKSDTEKTKKEETSTESKQEDTEETETEELKELAVEDLLEDVQQAQTQQETKMTGKAVVDIPEGFKEYLAPSGIYVTGKYPEDGSNIYIVTSPLYEELPDEKGYKHEMNENISVQVGEKVEITLTEYAKITVDGCDAIRARYTYSHDGMKFTRLEYTVNTDITTTIAYTQVGDADWMDEYEESAMTMRIE